MVVLLRNVAVWGDTRPTNRLALRCPQMTTSRLLGLHMDPPVPSRATDPAWAKCPTWQLALVHKLGLLSASPGWGLPASPMVEAEAAVPASTGVTELQREAPAYSEPQGTCARDFLPTCGCRRTPSPSTTQWLSCHPPPPLYTHTCRKGAPQSLEQGGRCESTGKIR